MSLPRKIEHKALVCGKKDLEGGPLSDLTSQVAGRTKAQARAKAAVLHEGVNDSGQHVPQRCGGGDRR